MQINRNEKSLQHLQAVTVKQTDWKGTQELEPLVGMQSGGTTLENVWQCLKKLDIFLPNAAAILSLAIYTR